MPARPVLWCVPFCFEFLSRYHTGFLVSISIEKMSDEEKSVSPAEEEKKLGNGCFAKKEYDEAIKHYTKAIELDDTQAAFYSNRSACYASKKEWQAALGDALQCVSKDAKFVKGYVRLAVAQMELDMLEDADKTLRVALTLEPGKR